MNVAGTAAMPSQHSSPQDRNMCRNGHSLHIHQIPHHSMPGHSQAHNTAKKATVCPKKATGVKQMIKELSKKLCRLKVHTLWPENRH